MNEESYRQAAHEISRADALLIGAGAGMGVDSGLPDFRGDEGFWKAYPPFRGKSFASLSNPKWFLSDPEQAWGYMGHRLHLYRDAIPHEGFQILRRWAGTRTFVFTSNVDGHFQKAGFADDRIMECHGSIHHLQCLSLCSKAIWSADNTNVDVDARNIRARSTLPRCPLCNALARPNILMFGDWGWVEDRSQAQYDRYRAWLREVKGQKLVAIEIGAGLTIPSVRVETEYRPNVLIRINPREAETGPNGIALAVGALEALREIDRFMGLHMSS